MQAHLKHNREDSCKQMQTQGAPKRKNASALERNKRNDKHTNEEKAAANAKKLAFGHSTSKNPLQVWLVLLNEKPWWRPTDSPIAQ